jgi:F-type H+-transporting ATPase subunit b
MHLEFGQIFTQIVSFLIMLWVLKRYAWKPLLSTLDERKNRIKSEIKSIEKQKKDVESLIEEYRNKLKEIDVYARTKTQEAVDEGKRRADEIQKEAQQKAQAMIIKAQNDLQKEIIKAKEQLKDELVNMTVAATEKILQKNLSKEKQKDLLSDFVEQVGTN